MPGFVARGALVLGPAMVSFGLGARSGPLVGATAAAFAGELCEGAEFEGLAHPGPAHAGEACEGAEFEGRAREC